MWDVCLTRGLKVTLTTETYEYLTALLTFIEGNRDIFEVDYGLLKVNYGRLFL